jgi:hypothetical protein
MPEPPGAREDPAGMAQEKFQKRQNLLNRVSIKAVKGCVERARFVCRRRSLARDPRGCK